MVTSVLYMCHHCYVHLHTNIPDRYAYTHTHTHTEEGGREYIGVIVSVSNLTESRIAWEMSL